MATATLRPSIPPLTLAKDLEIKHATDGAHRAPPAVVPNDHDETPSRPPVSPHDRLFRYTFSRPEHAAGELRTVLPPELVARIDFSTLCVLSGSYVDEALRERESDLLYAVALAGSEALVYVLFEHQSSAHDRMPLRFLGYMLRIWEGYAREHPSAKHRLPPIVPVVLHHDGSSWSAPRRLSELLGIADDMRRVLAPFIPDFAFVLDDLPLIAASELRAREQVTALARLVLFVLQRAREAADLPSELEAWVDLMAELSFQSHGPADLAVIVRYIYFVAEVAPDTIPRLLQGRISSEAEEAVMTTAEQLIAQGRAEGEAKGRAEGRASTLVKLLTLRFGTLPQAAEARVRNGSIAELDMWTERVLSAPTLQGVLDCE